MRKKKIISAIGITAICLSMVVTVGASSQKFSDKFVSKNKWTVITSAVGDGSGKVYGTVSKILNSDKKDAGYKKIKLAVFYGSSQLSSEITAEKGKAYSIKVSSNKTNRLTLDAKGNNPSLDAYISGDADF
jgi:hypothetical protein